MRYVRYTARTQPDFALDDALKARLRRIAANIERNRTALATYESQLVVRDFGTHVTTSVDVGAAMVQVAFLPVPERHFFLFGGLNRLPWGDPMHVFAGMISNATIKQLKIKQGSPRDKIGYYIKNVALCTGSLRCDVSNIGH